jgi:prepilin-type N-terminal cleavage/methylation domain-containing protein
MIRTSRGFSLIEVVVAMGVLGIGLAATVPLITYGVQRNAQSRRATGAQWVADQVLQRLRLDVGTDRDGDPAAVGLLPEVVWNAPSLPHGLGLAIGATGACTPDQSCCQPTGAADGIAYNVAFPFRAQGQDYFVCYAIGAQNNVDSHGNPIAGIDGNNQVRALQVKVLWLRSDGAWSYRAASGFVLGQAAMTP